jgi:hypothetical protein
MMRKILFIVILIVSIYCLKVGAFNFDWVNVNHSQYVRDKAAKYQLIWLIIGATLFLVSMYIHYGNRKK